MNPNHKPEKLPARYRGELHPTLGGENRCQICAVGKHSRGMSIMGSGPDDLSKVRLVVISDHPGAYEEELGYCMVDNYQKRYEKKGLPKPCNAGASIRNALTYLGFSTYEEVWFTNAVKCNTRNGDKVITLSKTHIRTCSNLYLMKELEEIFKVTEAVPILLAGGTAVEAMRLMDSNFPFSTIKSGLRFRGTWLGHRVGSCLNPAQADPFEIETKVGVQRGRKKIFGKLPLQGIPSSYEKMVEDIRVLIQE